MGAVVVLLFLLLVLIVVPIGLFIQLRTLREEKNALRERLSLVELRLAELQARLVPPPPAPTPPPIAARPNTPAATAPTVATPARAAASAPATGTATTDPTKASPPPAPSPVALSTPAAIPPVTAPATPRIVPTPPPSRSGIAIDWEQFMGAKLFAWLGGLAGFLAVAFFVKYSFEHELVSPEVRVALGFALSTALIVGGLLIKKDRFRITSQVLCATGIVSLYAVTFACNAVYHFAYFGQVPTFSLMVLITAAAFLLAVRTGAQVVAILGLLGGFLTPILLSTGQDNPTGLFGFVALLDAGLIAIALRRQWPHLIPLAAAGTVLMEFGWASKFFIAVKAPTAIAISLSMGALFLLATEFARRFRRSSPQLAWSATSLALVAFGWAFVFQGHATIAARPGLVLGLVLAADLCLLTLAWREQRMAWIQGLAGGLAFAVLALWTMAHLNDQMLSWALAGYLGFAVLHTAFPVLLARFRSDAAVPAWSQLYPPLALLLTLGPILKLETVSLLFWPAVLALDLVAVAIALLSASIVGLGAVLLLTLSTAGLCLFKITAITTGSTSLILVISGFSLFFFAAGLFLSRRLGDKLGQGTADDSGLAERFGGAQAQIPVLSSLLPFVLLVMMSQRLSLADPAPLFGVALLCSALVLGLARWLSLDWLPACGLAGVAAVEYAWQSRGLAAPDATGPLWWYVGFYAVYTLHPFLFRRAYAATTGPWAVAALSGIVQFRLIHESVMRIWPNDIPGAIPLLFAVAPLAGLAVVPRRHPSDPASQLNQLAWFGGAALFFITLVVPIQFERQWITVAWALEGTALPWLFHRVPHPGLRATGVVLLAAVFVRLALNPEVLSYHVRSAVPVFNWYLYTYGIAALCSFIGARLLAPPRDRVLQVNGPALLNTLGAILAFLLLNIEIADYFSEAGSTLTFQFAGNFARDLAYTVGWALFALALLGIGIWRRARASRYAAIGLLSVTLLKLFFHDLDRLGQLYRVGALVAVAAVAIVASFLYQRFIPGDVRSNQPPA